MLLHSSLPETSDEVDPSEIIWSVEKHIQLFKKSVTAPSRSEMDDDQEFEGWDDCLCSGE
jgi:hypothetical protein